MFRMWLRDRVRRAFQKVAHTGRGEVMRKEKWIVYRDRCQSLEKKLSLLEPERDRLRKGLVDIKNVYDLNRQSAAYDIARTALESSQPEGREVIGTDFTQGKDRCEIYVKPEVVVDRPVTVEELAKVLFGLAPATIETITLNDCRIMVDRLLDRFDVRCK